jgi:5'-nucleotidase
MRRLGSALLGAALAGAVIAAPPAGASPAGDGVVINEVYVNGGSTGATYLNKFVELYNPTNHPISVNGWSVQYRSATGTAAFSGVTPLGDHHLEPGGTLLVSGNSNAANGAALPTPDVAGTTSFSGSTGTIALSKSTTALSGQPAAVLADANLVDLVGYGTSNTYETAVKSSGTGVTSSLNRGAKGADTDNNSADFAAAAPTPVACGDACDGDGAPVEPPVEKTIAEIQGDGATSPLAGKDVITSGVVTAVYKTGGFSGAYVQTDGTGGHIDLATHTASDGIFVFSSAFAAGVDRGDLVKVTGKVSEFNGLTELSTTTGGWQVLDGPAEGVEPADVSFPLSASQRESLEGMLLEPRGRFTITNNYTTNQYAEIGLADGDKPLPTPTNVVRPGAPAAALQAENDARLVTLDDGASVNFLSAANQGTPLPWLTADNEVRVGAPVRFDDPVVLDYRNSAWRLQPTQQLTAGGDEPVVIGRTRAAAPKRVGGDVKIGTFNVLNYFATTAADWVASGGSCTTYKDREGNPITANTCSGNGPRGAADAANLARQQAKIVSAINTLDADVVSLEEIENSKTLGLPDRDSALRTLVGALNAAAGRTKWAFVPSPADVPEGEDVIRTAFIYQPKVVQTVGSSKILIGASAFDNAREPLAQAFKPVGARSSSTFAVIVNHFKSKGSGSLPQDDDQGDGQGASNYSRTLQAHALVDFADAFKKSVGTNTVFLTGDFNSYNEEDPVKIIEDAGYVNVPRRLTDKETYQFDGQVGSLDHVFASTVGFAKVTGADIWNINAYESLAREYSRFNYNVTDFYRPDPYRASDHDPEIVGFDPAPVSSAVRVTSWTPGRPGRHPTPPVLGAKVRADGLAVGAGEVKVYDGGRLIGSAEVADGVASVPLDGFRGAGRRTLWVVYTGSGDIAPSRTTFRTPPGR